MDGPFQLQARRIGNLLYITADGESWQWQILMETFVSDLLRAITEVKRKFAELGVSDKEILQIGAGDLEIAMSEVRKVNSPRNTTVQHV